MPLTIQATESTFGAIVTEVALDTMGDDEHPSPLLRETIISCVDHPPFDVIPQVAQGCKHDRKIAPWLSGIRR